MQKVILPAPGSGFGFLFSTFFPVDGVPTGNILKTNNMLLVRTPTAILRDACMYLPLLWASRPKLTTGTLFRGWCPHQPQSFAHLSCWRYQQCWIKTFQVAEGNSADNRRVNPSVIPRSPNIRIQANISWFNPPANYSPASASSPKLPPRLVSPPTATIRP